MSIIKDGIAILLNFLPTFIIICNLSSNEYDIVFRIGASTAPMNNEPPTQIVADVRCTQVRIACSKAI
jgi:hypothetical protein